METKKYTQFGTFSVVIMLPLLLLFSVLLIKSWLANTPDFYIHIFLVLTFLICLLIFYKLTIIVDRTHVSFKLGIGLVRKTYKIEDLKSCKAVTNSIFNGIGIRMLSNGWLYNVSGLEAIELQFVNKKSIVRIGTNNSDEISHLIQSRIGDKISSNVSDTNITKRINPLWFLSILLIFILIIIPTYQDPKVQLNNNEFKVKGIYGLTISYVDIEQIDTVSSLPEISLRTNGYAFGNTLVGNFKFKDNSYVKLFVKKKFGPYLLIKSKDKVPVYINFENKQKTIELFNKLKAKK